jgi:hypothetical protein
LGRFVGTDFVLDFFATLLVALVFFEVAFFVVLGDFLVDVFEARFLVAGSLLSGDPSEGPAPIVVVAAFFPGRVPRAFFKAHILLLQRPRC